METRDKVNRRMDVTGELVSSIYPDLIVILYSSCKGKKGIIMGSVVTQALDGEFKFLLLVPGLPLTCVASGPSFYFLHVFIYKVN